MLSFWINFIAIITIESLKKNIPNVVEEAVEIAQDLPAEVPETASMPTAEVAEDVVREVEAEIVEEAKTDAAEPIEVSNKSTTEAVEETIQASENFETQLEDEPAEVPQGITSILPRVFHR